MSNEKYRTRARASSAGIFICCLFVLAANDGRAQVITGKVPVGNLGHELYYEVQGTGEPVVLIHGLTLDLRQWNAQVDALAEKYQVIRYDVIGHGKSSGLSSGLPIGSVRDWEYLRELLDELEVNKAHVVGLSMGGGIAINFALYYPDRVQTLTPMDSRIWEYNVPSELGNRFSSYINVSRTQGVQAALPLWAADPLFAPANSNPEVREQLEKIVVQDHGALGAGAYFQWPNGQKIANPSPSSLSRLNQIGQPTQVMIGELDLIDFQLQANILDRDVPNSTKVVVSNAGHMSNMEQPEFVNAALLDFFAAHPIPVSVWDTDADGTWSNGSNWHNGIVRNAVGAEAVFGAVITQARTVNLDIPITVGRIDFKNTHGYTVTGTNSITLDVASGSAAMSVTSGSHTISAPVILADSTVVSVSPAASNLSITGGLAAANLSLVKAGAGTLTVNQLRAAGLAINGGKVVVASASGPAIIGAPTIAGNAAPTATLDLTDNAAVLDYSGTNTVARVRAQLLAGRRGPGLGASWTGMGITSSTAAAANQAAPDSRSLGFADNATLPLGAYTTFRGEPVDNTTVLVAYTRTGDANLDGVVNDNDVTIVGATYAPGVPQPAWALGDFDYNGFVDDDDVTLLGAFYDPSAPPLNSPITPGDSPSPAAPGTGGGLHSGVSAVPEPSAALLALLMLVVAAATGLLARDSRWLALVAAAAILAASTAARADIFRWDTGAVIPGTEGIVPGPGVQLAGSITPGPVPQVEHRNLEFADLAGVNLTGADFELANLTNAQLRGANLTSANLYNSILADANLSEANLANASLGFADFTTADFTGAIVTMAQFAAPTRGGLTKEQLYSTASYQAKDLHGIGLWGASTYFFVVNGSDLTGWDFSGQNLTGASLAEANLTNADFRRANLSDASLYESTLSGADVTGAVATRADFWGTTARGFTKEQLYSTASYLAKDLRGIAFGYTDDLTGWDFRGQNLTGARFGSATLTNANLSGANLTFVNFGESFNLVNTNLTGADARGAIGRNFFDAVTTNLIRPDGRIEGLNLAPGDRFVAYPAVPIPVKFGADFSIAPTATFDLTDNAAIIDYTATSPVSMVREKILTGRGTTGLGGKWNGMGITSSSAAAANEAQPDSRSLGYADNASLPLGSYTSFHGAPVDSSSVLIAFTRTGDANLDGVVNDDDVTIVGATYAPGVPQPSWALGDFDYNGFVDDDDVTLLGAFYDPAATAADLTRAAVGKRCGSGAGAFDGGTVDNRGQCGNRRAIAKKRTVKRWASLLPCVKARSR